VAALAYEQAAFTVRGAAVALKAQHPHGAHAGLAPRALLLRVLHRRCDGVLCPRARRRRRGRVPCPRAQEPPLPSASAPRTRTSRHSHQHQWPQQQTAAAAPPQPGYPGSVVELEDLGADFLGELLWVSSELDPW